MFTGLDVFLAPVDDLRRQLDGDLLALDRLFNQKPAQSENLVELRQLLERRLTLDEEYVQLRRLNDLQATANEIPPGGERLVQQIRDGITGMAAYETALLTRQRVEEAAISVRFQGMMTLAGTTSLLILYFAFLALRRQTTARGQAERALRESEARFRRLFEQAPIGMALVARDLRFVEVNESLCQMLGYGRSELLGSMIANITPPDDLDSDASTARRLFAGDIQSYTIERRFLKKHGDVTWGRLSAFVVHAADGSPIQAVGILEDVTERHESEVEREQAFREIARLRDQLERERDYLREEVDDTLHFREIVGRSREIKQVLSRVKSVAGKRFHRSPKWGPSRPTPCRPVLG